MRPKYYVFHSENGQRHLAGAGRRDSLAAIFSGPQHFNGKSEAGTEYRLWIWCQREISTAFLGTQRVRL